MYACTGPEARSHTLQSRSHIMHCKQLWWEKARWDQLDSDYMTCAEKRIVFTDVMCTKGFFIECTHYIFTKTNDLCLFI